MKETKNPTAGSWHILLNPEHEGVFPRFWCCHSSCFQFPCYQTGQSVKADAVTDSQEQYAETPQESFCSLILRGWRVPTVRGENEMQAVRRVSTNQSGLFSSETNTWEWNGPVGFWVFLLPVPPAVRAHLQSHFYTWMNLQPVGAHSDSKRFIISIESVGSDSNKLCSKQIRILIWSALVVFPTLSERHTHLLVRSEISLKSVR